MRAVTRVAIREARLKEIRQEMLNSQKLKVLMSPMHAFSSSADIFQNQLFRKILSGIPSMCQTVWIQIRSAAVWNDALRVNH